MRGLALFLAVSIFSTASAQAQSEEKRNLAKDLANPLATMITVPIQMNYDTDIGPDGDGSLWQMNIQPVIPFYLNDDWNVITRTIIPLIHQEDIPAKGEGESGLGDILQSFFFSPATVPEGGWIWGVGPVISLPTASDDALGTEKWALGPTAIALKQVGPWTAGLLVNHLWSVAGEDDRGDVSFSYAEPWLSYVYQEKTTISFSIESTYDWETDDAAVPLNFTVDRLIEVSGLPLQVGGALKYWAESPDDGPDGFGFRLQVAFMFPK
jgi:hypothetical protein